MSTKEAAGKLKISERTVRTWLELGIIKGELHETSRGPIWEVDPDSLKTIQRPKRGRPKKVQPTVRVPQSRKMLRELRKARKSEE